MTSNNCVLGITNTIVEKSRKYDFSKENDIFDLSPHEFYREIASAIMTNKRSAVKLSDLYDKYISNMENDPVIPHSDEYKKEYKKYRDKTTKRIRNAMAYLEEKYLPLALCEINGYYWENVEEKNLALNNETPQGMPLARALAYNLVSENLSNLLPPEELILLKPYFNAAKQSLDKFKIKQPGKIKAAKYSPYATDFIIEEVNTNNIGLLFDAIEKGSLIKANYDSIHGGIPEEIIFSPQQIRLQFQQTKIVGFVHNTIKNSDCTKETQVSSKGVYRHLSVNRMSDVKLIAGKYNNEQQEMVPMPFECFAHEWVATSLESAKFSEDQHITRYKDMTAEDQARCHNLIQKDHKKWCKVTATITLPKKFLDSHLEYDAWFFVNAISIYGGDLIATEPNYVVNEIKRRVNDQKFAYKQL